MIKLTLLNVIGEYYWMRTLKTIVLFGHNTKETYWTVKLGLQVHKAIIQNKWKIPVYLGWNIKSNICRKQQQTKAGKQSPNCYTSVRNFLYIAVRNLDICTEYVNQRVKVLFVIHQVSWSMKDIINRRTKVLYVINHNLLSYIFFQSSLLILKIH